MAHLIGLIIAAAIVYKAFFAPMGKPDVDPEHIRIDNSYAKVDHGQKR